MSQQAQDFPFPLGQGLRQAGIGRDNPALKGVLPRDYARPALDHSDAVAAWAKNDHLGFEVLYVYRGVVRKYRPDFLVRLKNGDMLVLETKGQDTEQDQVKRGYLDEWTQAVNAHGGFVRWRGCGEDPRRDRDISMPGHEARR